MSTQSKTEFGINQVGNKTPAWAQWMFRIFFYLVSFVNLYLAFDTTVPPELMHTILKWSTLLVMAVHGFSRMWGIDTKQYQSEANDAFNQNK